MGYDARVGFGFEKKRSGNRCWNKCIYFWEGCKKNCCRKTIPLNSFIDSFQVFDTQTQNEEIKGEGVFKSVKNEQIEKNDKSEQLKKGEFILNDGVQPIFKNPDEQKEETEVNMDDCFDNSELFQKYAKRKSKVYFSSRVSLQTVTQQDNKNCKIKI